MCADLALPLPSTGLSLATVPVSPKDPTIWIVGLVKYPLPVFVTLTLVTLPPVPINASAVAPVPPPPVIIILGGTW